jgi:hypothetical protein
MRKLALIALLLAAGCGESEPEQKKSTRLAALEPGQWELSSEVTSVDPQDNGEPAIDTPVGTRAAYSVCVGEGEAPTELFSGEGDTCTYDNYYLRNGRVNLQLTCTREGLPGSLVMSVDGTFETGQLSYNRNVRTILTTDGDALINHRVTGRRTGDCTPGADAAGNEAQPK